MIPNPRMLPGIPGMADPRLAGPFAGRPGMPLLGSMKKGGKVKKTGAYKLHKGEKVVPTGKRAAAKRKAGPLSAAAAGRIRAKANRMLGK